MKKREALVSELAQMAGKNFIGENKIIQGLGLCNRPSQYDAIISYITAEEYLDSALKNESVVALIMDDHCYRKLSKRIDRYSILVDDSPEELFYHLHHQLIKNTDFYETFDFSPQIGCNCHLHKTAVIEDGVIIGDGVTIGANSVINKGSEIGHGTRIGCCSIIGAQGFQVLKRKNSGYYYVEHVGGVSIGENVLIGDNVTVCNSLLEGKVTIGSRSLVDNHVQISHNCKIGINNVLTAGVILLGSAELQDNCWLAPGSLVMNRVVVEEGAQVGANSTANQNVKRYSTVVGTPGILIEKFAEREYNVLKLIKNGSKKLVSDIATKIEY